MKFTAVYRTLLTLFAYLSQNSSLNTPLQEEDKEIYDLIQKEKYRQYSGLELIASEVCIVNDFFYFFYRKNYFFQGMR